MWKKRYTFRLTEADKDVHDFIESSNETDSETIRKLLKFAIKQIEIELNQRKENELLMSIDEKIDDLQKEINFIKKSLNEGITLKNNQQIGDSDVDEDKLEKSMQSMLDAFGFSDE